MSRGAQDCLKLLRKYARRYERIYPYQCTLARQMGIKKRYLRKLLLELKRAGLLIVHMEGRTSAIYELVGESLGPLEHNPITVPKRKPPNLETTPEYVWNQDGILIENPDWAKAFLGRSA